MEVTAVEVGEPLAGPGVQIARPCVQLVVYCILAHPEELHPLLIDSTCKDERETEPLQLTRSNSSQA